MCGILGVTGRSQAPLDADALRRRGPDGEGRYGDDAIRLAVRRLAVIDLATGDQPLSNETGEILCIANCELYNYRELRAELESRGHELRSKGDVEVVPHLYEELGERCFERLRGMFAVALWDAPRGRLVLARDRFGIKPLYLADIDGELAFASEIAPLLALGARDDEDPGAIADYLAYGYVPRDRTGLESVRKLPPGHVLVREQGTSEVRAYYEPGPKEHGDLETALRESVRLHLRSDVELGVLLSGGLDSSLIAALAADELDAPLRTFTVGFADSELDEREPARAVARAIGSRHEEIVVETGLADDLPEIARRLEQPLGDPAAIPLWYLARAVSGRVKVALAGEGGDEAFGGYTRYAWDPKAARLARVLPTATLARLVPPGGNGFRRRASKFLLHAGRPEPERYHAWFSPEEPSGDLFAELQRGAPPGLGAVGRLQYLDLRSMLADDLLLKADKLSMAHSLELRLPLLDHELVEAGLALPDREKVRGVRTKVAIRRLVERRLGRAIARRPKHGLEPPLGRWLRDELRDLTGDVLGGREGPDDRKAALELLDRHVRGELDAAQRLYRLLMLGLWRSGLRSGRALSV